MSLRMLILAALAAALPGRAATNSFALSTTELRYGFGDNHSDSGFHHASALAGFGTPWRCNLGESWELNTRIDLAAGWLGKASRDAAFVALGPLVSIGPKGFPITFEAGVSPTLVSENVFGRKNIGGRFQFTDSIGFSCQVNHKLSAGYHFVHISNGGIYERNPGVNFLVFSVGCRF